MSLKKFIRRRSDLVDVNAELLAGVQEAEAARRGQGRPPEEEDEGEERARHRVGAGEARS